VVERKQKKRGDRILSTTQLLNPSAHKKTGRRKLNSPPGLKLLVRNYEIAP
jgi:hypothetical protein